MKTLGLFNQKGGVGKTTLAMHVAEFAAMHDKDVVYCDLDPQGTATKSWHLDAGKGSVLDVLQGRKAWRGICQAPAGIEHLFVAPASAVMYDATFDEQGDRALRVAMRELGGFDYAVLDCPPALGALSKMALQASDGVLVPLQPSVDVYGLVDFVSYLRKHNAKVDLAGVVLTRYHDHYVLDRQAKRALERLRGQGIPVLEQQIPEAVVVRQAMMDGQTVFRYPEAQWARHRKTREAFASVAKDMLTWLTQ